VLDPGDVIEDLTVDDVLEEGERDTWSECPRCRGPMCRCPACGGHGLVQVQVPGIPLARSSRDFGVYSQLNCGLCRGEGQCAVIHAERWLAEQEAKES
jgi:hypothetical protein